jgi:hypothetical protein
MFGIATAASGASHIWFKNVDKRILWKLTIPGAISAFIGAAFLSSLPGDKIKPFISIFLIVLGIYILIRFLFFNHSSKNRGSSISSKFLTQITAIRFDCHHDKDDILTISIPAFKQLLKSNSTLGTLFSLRKITKKPCIIHARFFCV